VEKGWIAVYLWIGSCNIASFNWIYPMRKENLVHASFLESLLNRRSGTVLF